MARDHARLSVQIWDGNDWARLSSVQQLVYLRLISSTDLSWCGVLPFIPARHQDMSSDMTPRKFAAAVEGLEAAKFVVVDRETAEVLVRTYVRWDGVLKQPNVTKAMVTALSKVHSPKIRRAIRRELVRLLKANPDAKGWKGFGDADPEGFQELMTEAFG